MITASKQVFTEAYSDYRWHEGYAKRAGLFVNFPEPVLVVGCGFGFLVEELLKLNKNTFGIDAAEYCYVNRETQHMGQWDILTGPFPEYGTVLTEDMLPWLTDAEAVVAANNCAFSGRIVVHLVTESGQAAYNYHSTGYWMTLTGQPTLSLEGM